MKLEVGMYVRTKHNGIFNMQVLEAIRDINCDYIEINYIKFPRNEILKTSHNIIDLIEVGDYVNGSKVVEISEYNGEKYVYVEETEYSNANQTDINVYYKNEYIETIVTKEQMEAIQYKVV